MSRFGMLLCLGLPLAAGCGDSSRTTGPLPPPAPLTVEEWKTLPVEQRYEPESFERLKLGDPRLKNERAWKQFFARVIVPQRKIDLPAPGAAK